MHNVTIRVAVKEDMFAVMQLIQELADYEKASNEVINTVEQLTNDGFGDFPCFACIVAEINNEIVGFALYYYSYSTWHGKSMYLEDICVTQAHRQKGIGKLLFDKVLDKAKILKMNRLEWQVLDWNTPAIEFYKKYNADLNSEWINGKIYLFRQD